MNSYYSSIRAGRRKGSWKSGACCTLLAALLASSADPALALQPELEGSRLPVAVVSESEYSQELLATQRESQEVSAASPIVDPPDFQAAVAVVNESEYDRQSHSTTQQNPEDMAATVTALPPVHEEIQFPLSIEIDAGYDSELLSMNWQDPEPIAEGRSGPIASEQTELGSAPQSNELVFLRRQTVLLEAGACQFDIGFAYAHLDGQDSVAILDNGDVIGVADARTRRRLLTIPLEIRYGLTDRVQLYCNVPFGYANSELAFPGFKESDDRGGIGDTRFGASMLVRQGVCYSPDVVVTVGATAPTADTPFPRVGLAPGAQLGEGYWAINTNLLCVHTVDPCVLFYGVGYNHRFDTTFQGVRVNPGEEINYQFGVGFAVNSQLTFSSIFQGAYLTETALDGDRLEGTTLEPMAVRFAVTWARCNKLFEPFAEIPMTDDAAARIGLTWTY